MGGIVFGNVNLPREAIAKLGPAEQKALEGLAQKLTPEERNAFDAVAKLEK